MFVFGGTIIIKRLHACCMKKVQLASYCTKNNPGAGRRLQITEDTEEVDLDDLDYEADFESFAYSHKQHMKEMEAMKEKLKYDIVKQKYFGTKYPNFLTWHDKEQIRLLHKKDPTEWNVMRLSEGFPALPEIIKKIITSKWRMEDADKMKRHDENVERNWRKLKNNEFSELPTDLVTHLKKFSDRQFNHTDYDTVICSKIEYKPKLKSTEFSDIITSYEKLKKKNINCKAIASKDNTKQIECDPPKRGLESNENKILLSNLEKNKSHIEEDTFIIEPINEKQSITLNSLRNKLKNKLKKGKNISEEDVSIIELEKKDYMEERPEVTTEIDQLDYTKYNTGKLMTIDQKKAMDYSHLIYPEKIKIPKGILKKGFTYKLNDCFYASDGTFLYRVPGLV